MGYRPPSYWTYSLYTKLALVLLQVSPLGGVCDFPAAFTSRTYWLRGRDAGTSSLSLVTYARTEIDVRRNSDLATVAGYLCEQYSGTETYALYVRTAPGSGARTCVEEAAQGTGYITHRETPLNGTDTLSDCSTQITGVDAFEIYPPVADPSPGNFRLALTTDYRLTSGNYYLKYSLAPGQEGQCTGDTTSVLSVYWDKAILGACDRELHPALPLSGYLTSITTIQPSVLGESSGAATSGILLLMWQSPSMDVRQIICVRYSKNGDMVHLSFDVTSASSAVCRKSAEPGWFGTVNGRNYMRMELELFFTGTTVLTTLSLSPISSTTPGLPPSSPAPPEVTCHVQFTFYDVMFSDVGDLAEFAAGLKSSLPSALVVADDRISGVVIQEGFSGRAVFTFDLHPPGDPTTAGPISFDVERFRSNVHTGLYTIVVRGQTYTFQTESIYDWQDSDPCPQTSCPTLELCWVLQGPRQCVDSRPSLPDPTGGDDGGGGGRGLSMGAIIGIAVACAVVVLVAIVVAVVLLTKRARDRNSKDGNSRAGSRGRDVDQPVYIWNPPISDLPYSLDRRP